MAGLKVIITNSQKVVKIPTGIRMLIRRACIATLQMENYSGAYEVNVTFVDDRVIHELNLQHRNIDRSTDVLSFPLWDGDKWDKNPETGNKMLGDVVISMEHAVEQAKLYGHSLQREVAFLTVHSMLHLLGYDHVEGGMQAVKMREKEEYVLNMLGLSKDASYVMEEE